MKNGFTLIETLVYLALYAILMTGILSGAYSLFGSSDRDATSAMAEEEGNFLIGKIDWSLSDAQTIEEPKNSGSELSVVHADGSSVVIWLDNTDMRIRDNNGISTLNNKNVSVTDLSFVNEGSGASENVIASFTLRATTSAGVPLSRYFSTLDYLQQ